MLPIKYFCSNKSSFVLVKFHGNHKTHKVEVNLATLNFGDINGFKTVACHSKDGVLGAGDEVS